MGCQESKGIKMLVLSLFSLSFLIFWCECWFVLSVGLWSSCHYYTFSSVHSCKCEILNRMKFLLMFPCNLQPCFLWKWGPAEPAVSVLPYFPQLLGKLLVGQFCLSQKLRAGWELSLAAVWSSALDQPGCSSEAAAAPPPPALPRAFGVTNELAEPSEKVWEIRSCTRSR